MYSHSINVNFEVAKEGFTFRFETFGQIKDALELIFSPSAVSVILYMAAIKYGVHLYRKMEKEFRTKEEALNYLSSLKREENWGEISFQKVDFKNGSGRGLNRIFTSAVKSKLRSLRISQLTNFTTYFYIGIPRSKLKYPMKSFLQLR